jgi:hypothetical protein
MNYLSFSLWGDNPLYNIGAIRNSELIKTIYPGWKMIVYYDNTVPIEIIDELKKNDTICVDSSGIPYGCFWRFFASDIEDAEYVCFRDCDSRISKREFLAVQEWIDSGKILHVMRDHPAHRIPYGANDLSILAGMWGIKSRIIEMKKSVDLFLNGKINYYGIDQTFLQELYKVLKNEMLTHDEFFGGNPFPIKRMDGRFIGERIDINENPVTDDYKILL